MRDVLAAAIDELCTAFERGGYNPTPIVDIGVLIASADGVVDARERAMLLEMFQTLLNTALSPDLVDHLITASLEVIEAAGAESRARLVAATLRDSNALEAGIRVALALAFATDGLSDAEQRMIERIASAGGMKAARLRELTNEIRKRADPDPISVRMSLVPNKPENS